MSKILDYLNNNQAFQAVKGGVDQNQVQLVTGLAESARSLQILNLVQECSKPVLLVEPSMLQANQVYQELSGQVEESCLHLYSADDAFQLEMSLSSPEIRAERVQALDFLLSKKTGLVITSLAGIKKLISPPQYFISACRTFDRETEVDLDQLARDLSDLGYIRQARVAGPGDFSIRGGIVDIFPIDSQEAVRMELFDVEIDSIRYFDVETQRSTKKIEGFKLLPASDEFLLATWKEEAIEKIREDLTQHIQEAKGSDLGTNLEATCSDLLSKLASNDWDQELKVWSSYIYPESSSVVDYLSEEGLLVLDEYNRLQEAEKSLTQENQAWLEDKADQGLLPAQLKLVHTIREALQKHSAPILYYSLMEKGLGHIKFDQSHHFQYRSMQQFYSQMSLLHGEVHRWMKQDYAVVFSVSSEKRQDELAEILASYDIDNYVLSHQDDIQPKRVQIINSSVTSGFELPEQKLALITEKEVFNRLAKKKTRRMNYSNAEKLKSYNELKVGDYVVHINHGIGRYLGIETMEINGTHKDYMTLVYRDDAKVFVPIDQLHLVQKYVGSEGKSPRLHKLGGTEWAKTKQKVRQQVEDISEELISLYAQRQAGKGYAYQADTPYQKEFEDAFPYSETRDQLRSADEIKADMEKEKPMDRLLIGDAGYGKTEVAMRAVFKAVQESKQAAFIVPTTVLAQQHYQSALERFEGFPVEIAVMSRFRSKKQQDETIRGLKTGKVDLVIGTHRLLSADIQFNDLGLLIVDEEQRFGVKHKEKLKQLKQDLDVLTLTATPIPRTLHMSILGIRDLSVIETPPADRFPVQTYVMEMNEEAIRQAIERELARGGQVFYLHNRVATIQQRASQLQELVPEMRVAYAHGQMSETQLEDVLLAFYEREFDLLVTTTIIETGIDMPNVNTLIVEDADRMGLSQLYQLRGRVGRSDRVAYAYLTYESSKILQEDSVKRLQALREFTELGSGFKIAMRDLSIRGAGDMLGKQQSGFIDSVGYEMYTQLLKEAIEKKQGETKEEKTDLEIILDVEAYIPSHYIADEYQKIDIYQRINRIEKEDDAFLIQDDLVDRFGDYPQEVSNLITIALIKMHGQRLKLEKIDQEIHRRDQVIRLIFSKELEKSGIGRDIFAALEDIPLQVDVNIKEDQIQVKFFVKKDMAEDIYLDYVLNFLKKLESKRNDEKTDLMEGDDGETGNEQLN